MNCWKVRRMMPGYLDGGLVGARADAHAVVRRHLEKCVDCCRELERYRQLSVLMSRVEHSPPPDDLSVRIKVAVAQARASRGSQGTLAAWASRAHLILKNILEPMALPASGGVLGAFLVFAVMYQFIAAGVPLGAVPNDLPTNLLQPARLETLAPFAVSGPLANDEVGMHGLLIEATVNAQGQLVNYQILSGPSDLAVRRQLDQLLLFSRFRPQMSFGRPTAGGRVVLSFSEIRVKG